MSLFLMEVPETMMNQTINNSHSRTCILENLRRSASHISEVDPIIEGPEGQVFPKVLDWLEAFKSESEILGGEVILCSDSGDQIEQLIRLKESRSWGSLAVVDSEIENQLRDSGLDFQSVDPVEQDVEVGVTGCEALVALTGSVMVSSCGGSGRRMNIFPAVHLVLAKKSQLVESVQDGFNVINGKYLVQPSQISLISGPSRTADIEKTLVMGAHGPKELIVLVNTGN